jgi:molybdate transport system ATP-binding protein
VSLRADIAVRRGPFEVRASVRAEEGETLALLGPNGAGKTTVVMALAGLVANEGSIEVAGDRIDELPPERRPLGVAFQGGALFPHLSVLGNVAFPLRARSVPRRDAHREASTILERLAPEVRRDARPPTLSGGETQRVALARAIVHRPRLLLLDEPASGLDVRGRAELRPVLADTIAGFAGVRLLVTHDPVEAMTLADHVVILEEGTVTQAGTFDEVRRAPGSRYAAELVGVNLFTGRLEPLGDGAGRLVSSQGDVVVGWPEGVARRAVDRVTGTLRPADVVVHTEEPARGSARNVWRGVVDDLAIHGERTRLRIATHPPLVAEMTAGSARRLGIVRGTEVWASFKAVEVEISLEVNPEPEPAGTLDG